MTRKSYSLFALVFAAAAMGEPGSSLAQTYWTDGHGDLGVSYKAGSTAFTPAWQLDSGDTVGGTELPYQAGGYTYAPQALTAFLDTERSAPSGSSDWLGVAPGTTVWRTGDTADPPNIGFQTYSSKVGAPSDWLDQTIYITLDGWSGPGDVALYQNITGLGTIVWFSTYDPEATADNNTWNFEVGDHIHLNWLFTKPGYYELTFEWSGTYTGGKNPISVTGLGTFGFQVTAIPEPATWLLLLGGAAFCLPLLRRYARS